MNNCFVKKLAETVDNNNLPLMPVSYDFSYCINSGLLKSNTNELEQISGYYATDFIEIQSDYNTINFQGVFVVDNGQHRCGIAIYDSEKNILSYSGNTGSIDLTSLSGVAYFRASTNESLKESFRVELIDSL